MFGLEFFAYEAIELAAPTSQRDNQVQRRRRQTRRPRAKNIRLTRRANLSCAFCPSCQSAAGVRACPGRVKMSPRDRTCQRPPSYFAWGCFRYFGYESRVGHAAGLPGRSSRPRPPYRHCRSHPALCAPLARRRNKKGQPLCPSFGVAVSCLSRLKRSRWCSRQRTVNGLGRD